MALATDREKCAHLLRRFALGASEAELDFYLANGLSGAKDKLLGYADTDEGFTLGFEDLVREDRPNVPMPFVVGWWSSRMLVTRRPLQEKMTLFWHDHFATSASKVQAAPLMHQQNETIRQHATGSFKDLLTALSKDPAMLRWLDAQENVKGKAQENFAREIMELFTLGVDNYTEMDVQEAARAFTGWSFRRQGRGAQFFFRRAAHDTGSKTILGQTGNFDGDDVINILCGHPQTAKYLVGKLWTWFAYPNPEPALVDRLAQTFRKSDLNIRTLLRAMMDAPEFYSAKAERGVIKNPVDFVMATMRQLGMGVMMGERLAQSPTPLAALPPALAAADASRGMGMHLLYPPDVAGWDGGEAWITSATMVERIGWADRLFGTRAAQGKRRQGNIPRYPAYGLLQEDPTPEGIAKKLVSVFDVRLKPEKVKNLAEAARRTMGDRLTPENANEVAGAVTRLIFASPEFQFA